MKHQPNRTLAQLLTIRMSLVALGVSFALIALTTLYYMLDTPKLRRLTLELQVHHIIDAMQRGEDPATSTLYKIYPGSYGFRIFDHRRASERKLIAEANAGLLTSIGTDTGSSSNSSGSDLVSGLSSITSGDVNGDGKPDNIWLMTSRGEIGDHIYWVQAAMVDDPAWQWKTVLGVELFYHVVVPIIFIVPALMLAANFVTRRALRPLARIAQQANELSNAVASGRTFNPITREGLPLEFDGLVAGVNAMVGKLDRSLTLQKAFTSDVAHQLRTPLAVLLLEVSALPTGDALNHVKRELGDLADLVNQLLRFAQAEDAMAYQRHAVDIAETARKVCEDLAGAAFGTEKQIEFDAPDQGVFVSGQPALIETAIRNIVDNAIKLSPQRSTIFVRVDTERKIIVEDCGPGVPDGQKELIFKRFWRADGRRTAGNGIGLTLVRRIAFLHGGDVHVEDRPGGGARFVVTLGPTATT